MIARRDQLEQFGVGSDQPWRAPATRTLRSEQVARANQFGPAIQPA